MQMPRFFPGVLVHVMMPILISLQGPFHKDPGFIGIVDIELLVLLIQLCQLRHHVIVVFLKQSTGTPSSIVSPPQLVHHLGPQLQATGQCFPLQRRHPCLQ